MAALRLFNTQSKSEYTPNLSPAPGMAEMPVCRDRIQQVAAGAANIQATVRRIAMQGQADGRIMLAHQAEVDVRRRAVLSPAVQAVPIVDREPNTPPALIPAHEVVAMREKLSGNTIDLSDQQSQVYPSAHLDMMQADTAEIPSEPARPMNDAERRAQAARQLLEEALAPEQTAYQPMTYEQYPPSAPQYNSQEYGLAA